MTPLQWRHYGRDSVSNHQPHDCLLNRLFRRRSKKTSKLRVTGLCAGNSPGTVASNRQITVQYEFSRWKMGHRWWRWWLVTELITRRLPIFKTTQIDNQSTYWSRNSVAATLQTIFSTFLLHFPQWKYTHFDSNFTEICYQGFNWQWFIFCSATGLAPKRRQTIIWTNDNLVYARNMHPPASLS